MRQLPYIKQEEQEPLFTCVKWFKEAKDVFNSHLGTQIFDESIETTREWRNEEDEEFRDALTKIHAPPADPNWVQLIPKNCDRDGAQILVQIYKKFSFSFIKMVTPTMNRFILYYLGANSNKKTFRLTLCS